MALSSALVGAVLDSRVDQRYWLIEMLSDPLEQVPEDAIDALTVVLPMFSRVATPGLAVENVSSELSPDVQVALFVTLLLLLSVAVN